MINAPVRTGLAVLATVAATGIGLAVPASAQTAEPEGKVTASGGLIARSLPTTFSANTASLPKGDVFPISCRVTGSVVFKGDPDDGNAFNQWYRLPASNQWVSEAYVKLVGGPVPVCGNGKTTKGKVTTTTLVRREAPTTKANAHGAYTKNQQISLVCKLDGQSVNGNTRWYLTTDDLWVSARYVANVGASPAFCTN